MARPQASRRPFVPRAGPITALMAAWLVVCSVPGSALGQRETFDERFSRAETLLREARYADAVDLLTDLRTADGLSTAQRAEVLDRLAGALIETGRYEEALDAADAAGDLAGTLADDALLSRLEVRRGSAWRFRGSAYRALGHYQEALALADRAGRDDLRAQALVLLSSLSQDLGDWSRVLDYAEQAFTARSNPSDADRFIYLLQRGVAYFEFQDGTRAEEAFRAALEIAERIGHRRGESMAAGELGIVAWEHDRDRDRALDLYDRALAIAREIGVVALQVIWLNNSGAVLRDTGETEAALERFHAALALEPEGNSRPYLLKNIGQVLAAAGRSEEAERFLLEAVEAADAQGNPKIRWQARMELGDLLGDSDADRAGAYFAESLDLLEEHHGGALLERFQVGILGRALAQYDPYDRYVRFLLEQGDAAAAFVVAERARARVFLETLREARAQLADTLPPDYLAAETELLQRISARQARLRAVDLSPAERRDLMAGIDADEEALTALHLRLAAEQPAVADARYPRVWSADELRVEVLQPDEALAMFFLGRDASAGWLVHADGLDVVRLPEREAIEDAIGRLLPTLQSPRAELDEEARRWLSDELIAPFLARLSPGTHLVVVPHAVLHYLPFEALSDESGGFLVERNTVSYAPSVSSLAFLRLRERGRLRPATLLAVGSPDLPGSDPSAERARPMEWIARLEPLPHSAVEIQRIAATFSPDSRRLEGELASEGALRAADLREISLLHFATHALIDEERPERSGLALTAGTGNADGILQPREVYGLQLDAALVTLSACQTALGREMTGEGMIGMSRAFFYAGAASVASSLWNVNDAAAAELMAAFYEELRAGRSVDRALAEAKRDFLARGDRWEHPFYWAPFVVSGHARVAIAPPAAWSASSLAAILGVVVLAVGGLIAWRTRGGTSGAARA